MKNIELIINYKKLLSPFERFFIKKSFKTMLLRIHDHYPDYCISCNVCLNADQNYIIRNKLCHIQCLPKLYNRNILPDDLNANDNNIMSFLSEQLLWLYNRHVFNTKQLRNICCKLYFTHKDPTINYIETPLQSFNQEQTAHSLIVTESSPLYQMEDVIMSEEQKSLFDHIKTAVEFQDEIYNNLEFIKIDKYPQYIINIYGPTGTGKTMFAHALAKSLNKKIILIDSASLQSQYVSVTEKNIQYLFKKASESGALICFNEADSFLSKRNHNVTNANYYNSIRAQLLNSLDLFSGIVVFTTNLNATYDTAFKSRIRISIAMKKPDLDARKKLLMKMIPTKIREYLVSEDIDSLAQKMDGFSGRDIRRIIYDALVIGCSRKIFNLQIFIDAISLFTKEQNEQEDDRNKTLSEHNCENITTKC